MNHRDVVRRHLASGARIVSDGYDITVVEYGHATNHLLHAVLTILTVGAWLPIWAAVDTVAARRRRRVTIHPDGTEQHQRRRRGLAGAAHDAWTAA